MRQPHLLVALSAVLFSAPLPWLAAQTAPTAAPTVQVYSREVVVDIDVTDAKGNPVHGLTPDDFTVLEDGHAMAARSFREHRSDQPDPTAIPAEPFLPPNTFTNVGAPEGPRPLNILLIDSLDTPISTQAIVQKRVTDFVEKMPTGTRVAVFGLSSTGQLSMVQGFTTDAELLKKALKSKALSMQVPTLEDAGQDESNSPAELDMSEPTLGKNGRPITASTSKSTSQQPPRIDLNVECAHAAARVQYTSNAFAEIARFVAGMPGRKNLIWYSGGFPERMRDKQGGLCYDAMEDINSADDLLQRARVTVYPVDPRALDVLAKNNPTSRIVSLQKTEHLYMEAIAENTGGKTFFNNNDLAAAASQAVDAGSNYYTFIYVPTNQATDTRHRTISVKVDKPDVTLVYKDGYNAYPQGLPTTPGGRPYERATPLQTAMMRGALQPSEVLFHITATPSAATETTLPPGNNTGLGMKPPYRRLTLTYNIDLNSLQFEQAQDGNYHGQFEYAVDVYDSSDGKLVNSSLMAARPSLPPDRYQLMLTSGANLRQEIDIPAKGDYTLRIGVHDVPTDRVGAVEIPSSSLTPSP